MNSSEEAARAGLDWEWRTSREIWNRGGQYYAESTLSATLNRMAVAGQVERDKRQLFNNDQFAFIYRLPIHTPIP